MAFDVDGARKAGYSDAEIAAHLSAGNRFDAKQAKAAGYSDSEIIAYLSGRQGSASQIPGPGPNQVAPAATTPAAPSGPTSVGDAVLGAGEAALSTLTGMTGGALGMVGGTAKGVLDSVMRGDFGTSQGANAIEQQAAAGAQALTYAPRTTSGQEQTAAIGGALQAALPVMPLTAELGMVGRAAAPIARTGVDAVQASTSSARALAAQAAEAVKAKMPGAQAAPRQAGGGSVGAAGTDVAAQRVALAESLPVPIRLTKGQAERSMEQVRFERETAKDPANGAALRERFDEQNAQLPRNFEALIDETGAQAASLIETGRTVVDEGLAKPAARAKAEYRVKYREAEKAGQMEDPVPTAPLVDFIAENASFDSPTLAPTLALARKELVRLGGAELVDGQLVPKELPLKQVELLRRQINTSIGADATNATNMRFGVQLKRLIDEQTEGLGGDLYRDARKARQRYAQLYEDNAVISNLLKTRRGSSDRQVALEDVFAKSILGGTRQDLTNLRRTLHVSGGEGGVQAWKELQGATLKHLLDEATKGVGMDARGNPVFSAAKLNNAIRALDQDGKLDFVLSKKGAQTVRDLNELSKVVNTVPAGSVNSSNTASVVLAALAEAGVTGSMTGLPVPVVSGLKMLANQVRDRKVRARIQDALNNPAGAR